MIVVDVNAIVYLWIPGGMTGFAERALRRDPEWVSSILWRSEFRNVLAGLLRRGDITTEAMDRCLAGAEAQLAGREYLVPSAAVMREVGRSKCTAYDCEYAALARELGVSLVTSDGQLLREFRDMAVSLKDFANGAGQAR